MSQRRDFLDWLRVLAFALLILFHVGMLYVAWPYNLKSPRLAPGLEWVMMMLVPWRLALIFLIAGVASRFLAQKLGPGRYALDRLLRLQPPILTGMFVVIPPQTYVMLLDKGLLKTSYLDFWLNIYLRADQTLVAPLHRTMPTWDHLWFLVYLFVYGEAFALAFALAGGRRREARPLPLSVLLTAPALALVASNLAVAFAAPRTDAFFDDWGAQIGWIGMFITGLALARRDEAWSLLRASRGWSALAAACLGGAVLAAHGAWLNGAVSGAASRALWAVLTGLYGWSMLLTLVGWAAWGLDHGSRTLTYLNQAVLPVYVLHQPLMLVTAFCLFPLGLPLPFEAALLVAAAGGGGLLIYQLLIRPFGPMRFAFGVKVAGGGRPPAPRNPIEVTPPGGLQAFME